MADQEGQAPLARSARARIGRRGQSGVIAAALFGSSVGFVLLAGASATVVDASSRGLLVGAAWACAALVFVGALAIVVGTRARLSGDGTPADEGGGTPRTAAVVPGNGSPEGVAPPGRNAGSPQRDAPGAVGGIDELTGLPGRAALVTELGRTLAEPEAGQLAVMAIDLDGFGALNDTLGHEIGDEILGQVASYLRRCVRPWDMVARIGGDEFAIVVADPDADRSVSRVHERLRHALGAVVIASGHEVRLGLSVGYAVNDSGVETGAELLRNADLALARARTACRVDLLRYEVPMREALLARVRAEQELRTALASQQLELEYQPVVALGDGRMVGAEALIRWRHPTRGLVTASEFVPLAEQMRIVHELGVWALRQACRDLARLKQAIPGLGPFDMSINVSGHQIEQDLVAEVAGAAADAGVAPGELVLEVTESVLARRPDEAADVLARLRALGCRIALDDFGTGYSSLSYLARFPVDVIKIDRSFVGGVETDPQQLALTRTIVTLGQALHLTTIAEGVETAEQAALLRGLGCNWAQGFALGRPMGMQKLVAELWSERRVISITDPAGLVQGSGTVREPTPDPAALVGLQEG